MLILPGIFLIVFLLLKRRDFGKGLDRRTRQLIQEGQNKSTFIPHELVIEEAGMHDWCELIDARYSWKVVEKVVMDKEHVFIFIAANQAIIVPRRLLPEGLQDEFLAALANYSGHPILCATGEARPGIQLTTAK